MHYGGKDQTEGENLVNSKLLIVFHFFTGVMGSCEWEVKKVQAERAIKG